MIKLRKSTIPFIIFDGNKQIEVLKESLLPMFKFIDETKPIIKCGQFCINDIPIGDWKFISNLRLDNKKTFSFDYINDNGEKVIRSVFLGCGKILVWERNDNSIELIMRKCEDEK